MSVWTVFVLAWLCFCEVDAGGSSEELGPTIRQEVKYVWPTTTWSIPLSAKPGTKTDAAFMKRLAKLGYLMYEKYVNEILPVEMKVDPKFAQEFAVSDASRINLAFLRWQRAVYHEKSGQPLADYSWDGSPTPMYDEVHYDWPEFYLSGEFQILGKEIRRLSFMYLTQMAKSKGQRLVNDELSCFVWAEVYKSTVGKRPQAHTGALTAGVLFAKYDADGEVSQKLAFEDPRGINPPFGKTHNHEPKQGELLIFPSWASHFVTPHRTNRTNVFWNFACWPPDGAVGLDWEDDATGDFIMTKSMDMRRPSGESKTPAIAASGRKQEL